MRKPSSKFAKQIQSCARLSVEAPRSGALANVLMRIFVLTRRARTIYRFSMSYRPCPFGRLILAPTENPRYFAVKMFLFYRVHASSRPFEAAVPSRRRLAEAYCVAYHTIGQSCEAHRAFLK